MSKDDFDPSIITMQGDVILKVTYANVPACWFNAVYVNELGVTVKIYFNGMDAYKLFSKGVMKLHNASYYPDSGLKYGIYNMSYTAKHLIIT